MDNYKLALALFHNVLAAGGKEEAERFDPRSLNWASHTFTHAALALDWSPQTALAFYSATLTLPLSLPWSLNASVDLVKCFPMQVEMQMNPSV